MKTKLTALVISIVTISTYTLGRLAFQGLTDLLQKVVGLRAETVAAAYVDAIEPTWFEKVEVTGDLDQEHQRLQEHFATLIQAGYINRVEVIRFVDRFSVEHILSVPADQSADYIPPGRVEQVPEEDLYAQRSAGYHGVLLEDGPALAGWIPVQRDGRILGMLIVYIDASETQEALSTATLAILIVMAMLILLSGLLAYKASATFEKAAVTDGLMGIYNHKFFKQRLEQEVSKSARYGQQTSLVMADIDFFKKVNDTYGHATGDLVLKQLAKWVTDTARNTDVVARYGGEEIGIILTHTGLAGAQEFAERLRLKVSQQVVKDPEEDAEFRVTISVGVAQWEKGVSFLDLVKRADAALYHSKHTGRNRVTIYQEDILPAPESQAKTS